ncbi:MAG: hypothetical protein RBR09_08635 [Desulfobulbaceae bacterium]|jgi:hypothetical protein|nr:hypothetical protein [Desulfobulbaceae bacterium]MDY0351306.1 hypothetical protein [Desulfobulbaceae bacterium]
MKKTALFFLFILCIAAPTGGAHAGVAEASTGRENISRQYDASGLTAEELKWFRTFLKGNFFTDGWERIADNLLQQLSPEERAEQQRMLTELGNKIGREWCRDNTVRKIDTAMLKKWGNRLKSTANDEPHQLAEVIRNIDGEVETLLD